MPYIYNGQPINGQITIDSVQFPSGWNFTLNPVEGVTWQEPEPMPDPVPEIPQVVTMRQARLALLSRGMLAGIDAAVQAMGEAARIEWEFADTVARSHPLVQAIGLTEAQLDELFVEAAAL